MQKKINEKKQQELNRNYEIKLPSNDFIESPITHFKSPQFSPRTDNINSIINNHIVNMVSQKSNINKNKNTNNNNNIIMNRIDTDPFSESQQKSIEEFKKVLLKIDENIQMNNEIMKLNLD
jgi:hypothetical protein